MGNLIQPPEEELESRRPKHIDFDVMCQIVNMMDGSGDDAVPTLEKLAGRDIDPIMDDALSASTQIAKSKNDSRMTVLLLMGLGDLIDYVDYYRASWLGGLCAGLEEKRGIEIPADFHVVRNLFWDLDGPSVQYVCDQRVLRSLDGYEASDEKSHPFIAMAGNWIDGYSVGLQFDALKEEMLA